MVGGPVVTFTLGLIAGLVAAFLLSTAALLVLVAAARQQPPTPDLDDPRTIDEWFGTGNHNDRNLS